LKYFGVIYIYIWYSYYDDNFLRSRRKTDASLRVGLCHANVIKCDEQNFDKVSLFDTSLLAVGCFELHSAIVLHLERHQISFVQTSTQARILSHNAYE